MCGINGFNFKDQDLIQKMNEKIQHRGPDQDGIFLDNNISLGHCRLSIIDLSENGKQPMFNEDKSYCIIFNGEIYNFQELRKDLEERGHRFVSRTDTEVVLHLYEDYKEKCLEKLNGIFAFAIYDIKNHELFLARDRIGVKPLYYYWNSACGTSHVPHPRFIFSSEIKAILEHDIEREIDPEAFNHYFRLMYVPAPLTMFKNIYKLPQAHWLRLNGRGMKVEKYWDLKDFKEIESEQEIIEKIQELMRRSVKGQLISDRPVGTFLSGGIDSTSVLGIAREFKKDKIKTFSVGFDVDDQNDKFNADLSLARKTSEFYDTEHHELIINSRDILNNLEKVVYHMDEPVAEATQIATFLLSELAKKEVAVVLGGDGGDELFGGYKRYYYSYWLDRYKLIRLFPSLKTKIYFKFMSQKEDEIASVLNSKINNGKITETFFRENYFKSRADFVNQYMLADLKTWLADESLMRSDKMTMAHGLEERVPILDHQLVELSVKIPCKYKMLNKDQGKLIFIKAMKKYLPEHVLNSRGKKVWMTPVSQWLRTDLNLKAREILSLDYFSGSAEYLDFGGISRMFEDHIKKRKYNLNLIWALINFQIWCKNYLR